MKPELIVFSQYKLGGVQSYYYNLLNNDPYDHFDKRWIFIDNTDPYYSKLLQPYNCCDELIFRYGDKPVHKYAKALSKLISNRPGIVMVNQEMELVTLHKYPRKHKTVIFVCHDENYLPYAVTFDFLIDVFIAHNPFLFTELKRVLPASRLLDIFYMPYGVELSPKVRKKNKEGKLRIVFIARLHEKKGIHDLIKIEQQLLFNNVNVEWTIIGDGPEKQKVTEAVKDKPNFRFFTPPTTAGVFDIASDNDIYILPSYLDGMPVALLEAMSCGLVPVISRFNEGIDSVVTSDVGYVVPMGDIDGFVQKIISLNNNRDLLESMSENSLVKATTQYEAKMRAKKYYDLFDRFKELKRPIRYKHIKYDGRLDYPFIPQFVRDIVHFITKFISLARN